MTTQILANLTYPFPLLRIIRKSVSQEVYEQERTTFYSEGDDAELGDVNLTFTFLERRRDG